MIAGLLAGKDIPALEVTCIDKHQNDVEIFLSLATIKDKEGNVTELIGITKDITERKQAEESLKESEERFELVMRATRDGVFDWNLVTNEIYYSPGWKRMLGYEEDELEDHFSVWERLTNSQNVEKSWAVLRDHLAGKTDRFEIEFKMQHKEGHWVDILSRANAIFDEQGKPVRLVGTHVDISERKRMEEALLRESSVREGEAAIRLKIAKMEEPDDLWKIVGEIERQLIRSNIQYDDCSIQIVNTEGTDFISGSAGGAFHPQYLDMATESCFSWPKTTHYPEEFPWVIEVWKTQESRYQPCLPEDCSAKMEPGMSLIDAPFSHGTLAINSQQSDAFCPEDIILLERFADVLSDGFQRFLDITERKRAEEELQRLASIVRHSSELVSLATLDGKMIFLNEAGAQILGINSATMEQVNIMQVIPDHLQEKVQMELLPALVKGGTWEGDLQYLNLKTGKLIDVHALTFTVADPSTGAPLYLANVSLDITERKRGEQALREANDIINRSPVVAFLWKNEEDWPVEFVSDNVRELFGHTAEEFTSAHVDYMETVHPEDLERVVEEKDRFSQKGGGDAVVHEPYRIVTSKGEIKWIDDRTHIRRDDRGRITHYQGIVLDITDRIQAEEMLLQSQKMEAIGQLAGGIAHDFNNMLMAILTSCDLLLLDTEEDDEKRQDIELIQEAGERAATLTRQILAFSRRQTLHPEVLNLNDVINDMNKMMRRLISENIELTMTFKRDGNAVKADRGQLEQVILNLVVNARDAMPKGGKLTIETDAVELDEEYTRRHPSLQPGSYVLLSLSDTGVGMDEETRTRIFEPFFTTKEVGEGTGMGLSTVIGIVQQSGGDIWTYSEPNLGTTFKIYLPRVIEESQMDTEERYVGRMPRGNEVILIAEDDELVQHQMQRILSAIGYTVLTASDGEEALQLHAQHSGQIHLLLTDVIMPGMSGRELADRLIAHDPEFKILYTSGYTGRAIASHGVIDSDMAFISKPFSAEVLANTVRGILDG
jgi:PAS domain S-box-containing protein